LILEVALTNVFRQPLDPRRLTSAHLGVDLGNVEDVHLAAKQLVEQVPSFTLIIVACDNIGRLGGEPAMPVKTYFGVLGVKSVTSLL
jgi:hypothetical protein